MSPIFQQPHHICIVVADIAAAIRYYESLGIGPWHDYPSLTEYTEVEMPNETGFRQLVFKYCDLPGLQLQLCEPGAADTPQRRFLESKGPGVFHLGFSVDRLNDAEQAGKAAGLTPLMRGRRPDGSGFTYFDTADKAGIILEIRKAKPA
ncbi:MAG TPA: VOC family protein [Dongiaceae bacterium]|nr:VOC family protein [Dongiaceae bacterium]